MDFFSDSSYDFSSSDSESISDSFDIDIDIDSSDSGTSESISSDIESTSSTDSFDFDSDFSSSSSDEKFIRKINKMKSFVLSENQTSPKNNNYISKRKNTHQDDGETPIFEIWFNK